MRRGFQLGEVSTIAELRRLHRQPHPKAYRD
jgi:hypothetical protein